MKTNKILTMIAAALFAAFAVTAQADQSLTVPVGSPVTFSVTVATGTAPFTYQWSKTVGGVTTPIAGATAVSYRIPAVAAADSGTYTCVVSNAAGNATSDNGIFTVLVGPGGVTISVKAL